MELKFAEMTGKKPDEILLIVPNGIEMEYYADGGQPDLTLLIVPNGIEICNYVSYAASGITFNRT